tara:strand:- start:2431 stop:2667 length:237 start_codon:yes stop_codon:yes gene_type:complete
MSQNDDVFVQRYIGQVNSELQVKVLEICNLKAQIEVANERLHLMSKQLEELRSIVEETETPDPDPDPEEEKPALKSVD